MFFNSPPPSGIQFGPLYIYFYSLCLLAAVWVGYFIALNQAKKRGISEENLTDLIAVTFMSGVIGARIGYVVQNIDHFAARPQEILQLTTGGLSIHGALITGAIALYLYAKKKKLQFLKLSDSIVLSLLVGQIIGRLGNYFNQELYGKPTQLPWKLFIDAKHRPAQYLQNEYFHPTFLYEMILHTFGLLILMKLPFNKQGLLTAGYLIVVGMVRFVVEIFRISDRILFGLSLAQLVSIAVIAIGIWLYVRTTRLTHIDS